MQPTEIPNTVAEIKQNFPNMPRHSWETTGLPSGGRPFPWKLHLQEADESACSPQADIPNRLKVVNATIQLQRKTIYTPNSDGSKCSFFTSFSTVTGSNGISLLFGLHFSICKFFYIYILAIFISSLLTALICPLPISLVRSSYSYSFVRCKSI